MITTEVAYQSSLFATAVLCTTVFGELFVFATVVMPGLAKLDNKSFLRDFQVVDGVIQGNEPRFVFVWISSVVAVLANAGLAVHELQGSQRAVLLAGSLAYLVGQLITVLVNIPRSNRVQKLSIETLSKTDAEVERLYFEPTWNKTKCCEPRSLGWLLSTLPLCCF